MPAEGTQQPSKPESVDDDSEERRPSDVDELRAYGEAFGSLQEWMHGSTSLALLEAALSSGVLAAAAQAQSPSAIATATGLTESRVEDLCMALYARGILDSIDGRYQLTPTFAVLISPDALQPLAVYLKGQRAVDRLLAHGIRGEEAYAALKEDELLAMAQGVTLNPGASLGRAAYAQMLSTFSAEVKAVWAAGGRHLELGCGVGGAVLMVLLFYPSATAVGVEREEVLLSEARRKARELGVADRVEWRGTDVRDLDEDGTFDVAFWSQFFFPSDTRAATLEVTQRALRPGGYLVMPILSDPPTTDEEVRTPSGREYAVTRLIYGSWGIPVLSAAQLQEEVRAAGFAIVDIFNMGFGRALVAQRPSS